MRYVLVVIATFLFSCSTNNKVVEHKQFPSYAGLNTYLSAISAQVENHNMDGLLKLMDEDYLQEQLYGLHQGNKERFINELFCGKNKKSQQFECPKFANIKNIRAITVRQDDDILHVTFEVKTSNKTIINDGLIRMFTETDDTQYYLFGAVG